MRIYNNIIEMINELARDLYEMGRTRNTATMQDKYISGKGEYSTRELTNVVTCVTNPMVDQFELYKLPGQSEELRNWANHEFEERISDKYINPGEAWKIRSKVWFPFIKGNGKFSYTYNERIRTQLSQIIEILQRDVWTRQAILSIWNPTIDINLLGRDRVPCSIYYHFITDTELSDEGKPRLNLIYNTRSCDFVTHMVNDIYLAMRLLDYVSEKVNIDPGKLFINMASLHYYMKDEKKLKEFMRYTNDKKAI